MNYKLVLNEAGDSSGVFLIEERTFIPTTHPRYAEFLDWAAEGSTPEPADPPPPPPADWRGFLAGLRGTAVFAGLRGQARQDVDANALATELRIALAEAAGGRPEPAVVQELLGELWAGLPAKQRTELRDLIQEFRIPLQAP